MDKLRVSSRGESRVETGFGRATREELFEDFFRATQQVLPTFESLFEVTGLVDQVLGTADEDPESEERARAKLRASAAWQTLAELYDYALDGVVANDPVDTVLSAADVLKLVTSNQHGPSAAWDRVLAMGDGRFALDDGDDLTPQKIALLAGVDPRTVRNAISAGEMVAHKTEDGLLVENASVRSWLSKRRGFRPTRLQAAASAESLRDVDSPVALGALLRHAREARGVSLENQKLLVLHPLVDKTSLALIEQGVFQLPLDAVYAIADFYEVNRAQLLWTVMRIYFPTQLTALTESAPGE